MDASICINDDREFDVTPGELGLVAGALRAHTGAAEARVMREVFWPMDEGGCSCLLVDALDAAEFAVFAEVLRRAYEQARLAAAAGFALWEELLAAVRADVRLALP
jgi:hypothetical protein